MIPQEFQYRRATSIDEAISLLKESGDEGKFLAGGHSLVPLMKLRLSEPGVLIDISRIPQLSGITEKDGTIQIGAGVTHAEVASSDLVRRLCPVVSECAAEIGDPQVRNRGTLGGSLAHADPAADYPAVMVALNAEVHIKGPGGWRAVKSGDFFQDLFTVDLAEDEIIAAVQFRPARNAAYAKLHQRASHYALVGVAAVLEMEGRTCRSASIGITGATGHAQHLANVESALSGKELTPETIAAAARIAADDLEEVNVDLHASEEYRRDMVRVFTKRAIELAASR
ncbi:MAG: xanthine dehydrogenase family protein subunit M [Dehalococcoidia bacterium]|nr:xanthine dehydrogenase family protein subunit M [Dehalococcoidia bacterium]